MSATNLLNIGLSGLNSSKKSLSTASHNISNANTEGYSRQRTLQQTKTPINYGDLILGTGSKIKTVERVHDQFLEKKLRNSLTEHHFDKERNFQLSQVEEVFNEIDAKGFSDVLNNFFNSFRELSKSPDDETIRSLVRDSAALVVKDFKKTKESLNNLQDAMSRRLEGAVTDINFISDQIANLNIKIREIENGAGETGDLRDQRDLLVSNLSEFFELSTFIDDEGNYNIQAEGVGTLVAGRNVQHLLAARSADSESHHKGGAEIFFKARPGFELTKKFGKGKLKAIYQTRNNDLKNLQEKVDDLAYDLAHSVNAIHRRGYTNKKDIVDAQGRSIAAGQQTGIDFFQAPLERHRAAEVLDLSSLVQEDLRNIATGLSPNAPGDNRVAIALSKLQYAKVLDEDSATFEETYLKAIGKVGLESKKARMNEDQSYGILAQNKAMKARVAGVSIDEETADMMKFQHAYDASARVMSVAEEMFDTVLNIKRL